MAAALPDWMMLERFVFRRDDDASFPDDEAAPFRAHDSSSQGDSFCVAFRIAEPPAISRLYLAWPGGRDPVKGDSCILVAAHRNLLLFRLIADPVVTEKLRLEGLRQDHFICRAHSSPSQPSLLLRKIPKCDIPMVLGVRNGKKITTQRSFDLNPVSMLCRGEEEFAMAQLSLSRPHQWAKIVAELCVLRSKVNNLDHKWKLEKQLPILYEAHEVSDLDCWITDIVIPFNNYLCWVNYGGGGILFCEVFQERPNISYLRLPIRNRCLYRRPFLDTHRSVCVTKGTMGCDELMFVDVARKDGKLVGPLSSYGKFGCPSFDVKDGKLVGPLSSDGGYGFTITYHALRTTESGGMEWDMVFFITSYELWDLNTSLPHEALMHPLVSMDKPNVVHFLLSEHIINKVSVVTIDMSTKLVGSIHPYIKGKEDLWGQDADMVRRNSNLLKTFLPSELPKFLNLTSSSEGVKKTTKTKSGKQVSVASVSPTIASRQVNVKTAATPSCPAYNTRSRKKLAM